MTPLMAKFFGSEGEVDSGLRKEQIPASPQSGNEQPPFASFDENFALWHFESLRYTNGLAVARAEDTGLGRFI